MQRIIIPFTFIFSLVFLSFSCSDNSVNSVDFGSGDDYLIYQKVLLHNFADQKTLIVLNDSTYAESIIDTSIINYYRRNIPDLSYNTITDYISKNETRIKLLRIPNIQNLVFRSEFKIKQKDTVSVTLSRVGYNELKTQAMLTISKVFGPLAGAGYLVFLKKDGNTWTVTQVLMTWIS